MYMPFLIICLVLWWAEGKSTIYLGLKEGGRNIFEHFEYSTGGPPMWSAEDILNFALINYHIT